MESKEELLIIFNVHTNAKFIEDLTDKIVNADFHGGKEHTLKVKLVKQIINIGYFSSLKH